MFIGHYGPAVWDTQRGHGTPLVTLWQGFLAVQFVDIIWAVLVIVGIEGPGTNATGMPIFQYSLVAFAIDLFDFGRVCRRHVSCL